MPRLCLTTLFSEVLAASRLLKEGFLIPNFISCIARRSRSLAEFANALYASIMLGLLASEINTEKIRYFFVGLPIAAGRHYCDYLLLLWLIASQESEGLA